MSLLDLFRRRNPREKDAAFLAVGVPDRVQDPAELTPAALDAAERRLEAELHARYPQADLDRKSTRLNSSHIPLSRMPSSA